MAFGSQMHDCLRPVVAQHLIQQRSVADITLDKAVLITA